MIEHLCACLLLAGLATGPGSAAPPPARADLGATAASAAEDTSGWVVHRADNICGLDDARMLSNPARVDYPSLLDATERRSAKQIGSTAKS